MTKKIKQEKQDQMIKTEKAKTRKSIQKKTVKLETKRESIKIENHVNSRFFGQETEIDHTQIDM